MKSVAGRFGAAIAGEGSQMEATIEVPAPDDSSIFEEALYDGGRRSRRCAYTKVIPT
ncbi:MAG: hypothetical protein WAL83_03900 [Arenicellales bacterium]